MQESNVNQQPMSYADIQTSAIYDRLRREEKEEPKQPVCISPLAFLNLLPRQFTTAIANKLGEEMDMKTRTVSKHLRTLCLKGYIERVRQGVYNKASRKARKSSTPHSVLNLRPTKLSTTEFRRQNRAQNRA